MTDQPPVAFQHNWVTPPGRITTRCPDCDGRGSRMEPRAYSGSDGVGNMMVPVTCPACRGEGDWAGLASPA